MMRLSESVPEGVAEGMIKALPYIQKAGNEMTNAIKNIKCHATFPSSLFKALQP